MLSYLKSAMNRSFVEFRRRLLLCSALCLILMVARDLTAGERREQEDPLVPVYPAFFNTANRDSQVYIKLSFEKLAGNYAVLDDSQFYREPYDADSIEMWFYQGGVYYHPTLLSRRVQNIISTYRRNGDEKYLERAEKLAARVLSMCFPDGDAVFAGFPFRFAVHGDSALLLSPPWVSGMTQGELLMAVVRLFKITGRQEYMDAAHLLFNSFLHLRRNHDVWVARIDGDRYYWIEEYPHDRSPGMTLNGFMSGVFGIYDYYWLTGDNRAKTILDMCLATIKHYLPQYRQEDEPSFYCLGHRHVAEESGHFLHVRRLRDIYRMTGDDFFDIWADSLESDGNLAYRTNRLVRIYHRLTKMVGDWFSSDE